MTTQINVKVSEEDLERWKLASTSAGRTLSEWLRNLANDALTSAFERANCKDCGHARHTHRGLGNQVFIYPLGGFGSCCQVLNCSCSGFAEANA